MNFYLLLVSTSLMCLSWNYPLSANMSIGAVDKDLFKQAQHNRELSNHITDHKGLVKLPSQNNNCCNYSNKTNTRRELITQQIPSIPLGTLEPEPINPSPIPNTLPNTDTSIPLTVPERSPTPPQLAPIISPKIKVNRIEVNGSTVFSREELARAVDSFVGQELSYE